MSWLYLPELVADCSQADCLAGERSAPSKSTNTASASCSKDSATDTSKSSPSGMTCEPLTETNGAVESMLLPPGFLASLSARPVECSEKTTLEICGPKSRGYLAKFDHTTGFWRTSQRSLLTDTLDEFSAAWPSSGVMHDGIVSARPALEPTTYGGDCGLLPTPTTPTGHAVGRWDEWGGAGGRAMLRRYLTTPTADDTGHRKRRYAQGGSALSFQIGGRVNPEYAEWMMGWPINWTALEPLATDKFQSWLHAHGVS